MEETDSIEFDMIFRVTLSVVERLEEIVECGAMQLTKWLSFLFNIDKSFINYTVWLKANLFSLLLTFITKSDSKIKTNLKKGAKYDLYDKNFSRWAYEKSFHWVVGQWMIQVETSSLKCFSNEKNILYTSIVLKIYSFKDF